MRRLMEENERKDMVLAKLEENFQKQLERYESCEKDNKLLTRQVENHNEKEKMMSENLIYYMDENIKLKNERKVIPTESSDGADGQRKLYQEFNRFKQYVNDNFLKKTDNNQQQQLHQQ